MSGMIGVVVIIIAVLFLGIIIGSLDILSGMELFSRRKKEKPSIFETEKIKLNSNTVRFTTSIPKALGAKPVAGLSSLVQKLEIALDSGYMKEVKNRILKKELLSPVEYDHYLLEFKRFLLLTSMVKNVPMFNDKVDIIWHEMLMFTKSYQKFCNDFVGDMIHHEPNTKSVASLSDNKAFFCWLYSCLFEVTEDTKEIYPGIFSANLEKNFIEDFGKLNESKLQERYFNPLVPEAKLVAEAVISNTRRSFKQIYQDLKTYKTSERMNRKYKSSSDDDSFVLYQSLISNNLLPFEKEGSRTHSSCSSRSDHKSHSDSSSSSSHSTHSHSCSSSHHSCSSHSCSSHSCSSCSSCSS